MTSSMRSGIQAFFVLLIVASAMGAILTVVVLLIWPLAGIERQHLVVTCLGGLFLLVLVHTLSGGWKRAEEATSRRMQREAKARIYGEILAGLIQHNGHHGIEYQLLLLACSQVVQRYAAVVAIPRSEARAWEAAFDNLVRAMRSDLGESSFYLGQLALSQVLLREVQSD